MGKTEKGAVWLDPEKTSPYEFFQYWRNVADADVIKCLKLLTFVPIEEIEEMERTMEGAAFNKAKELLAFELTKMIHGEEEANKALTAARSIFGGSGSDENMPTDRLPATLFEGNEIGILDLLVAAKLAPSKREARNLIAGGGVMVDDEKIGDPNARIKIEDSVIVRKGKKAVHKVMRE